MKRKQFWIGMLSLLFALLSTYLTFQFFSFPENVLQEVNITNHSTIEKVNNIFRFDFYLLTIDALLLLILLYILFSASMSLKKTEIIYIPKYYGKADIEKYQHKEQPLDRKIDTFKNEIEDLDQSLPSEDQLQNILTQICHFNDAVSGAFYQAQNNDKRLVRFMCGFAFSIPDSQSLTFEFGEGLVGQCAKSKRPIHLKNISTEYFKIISGLGSHSPSNLLILPILDQEEKTLGVLELAFFNELSDENIEFIKICASIMAEKLEADFTNSLD
ncbi:GAF domain-containing protein [Sediminitomix flava]|uniref:GAF domain-containing protein n=1 Tax=Sediminitomix flava TaxID=379075 RepID=A0A315ZIP1_SEDFL|nr:GAF domain-containing protein [Sediminitomix flava]PWJ44688.1 GAF domain-containing protein [Sediminitomix flava]